jgi:Domain of unknown function (DUF1992)
MTERKPRDLSFTSWIDQQINEAAERGAFDNLPGTGKPLPKRDEDAAQAWLRDYLRREGVSADELLPVPLQLRKEIERLTGTVADLPSEHAVRAVVADLNRRILDWRRIPEGPPVYLRLADEEMLVSRWREAHAAEPPAPPPTPPPDRPVQRWRRRRNRKGY